MTPKEKRFIGVSNLIKGICGTVGGRLKTLMRAAGVAVKQYIDTNKNEAATHLKL